MEPNFELDMIFGTQLDCRGPLQQDAELDDPIGDELTKMRLDFLAKNLPKVPIHVLVPTTDDILGITTDLDVPLVKHEVVEDPAEMSLRKKLSDEEVAEIAEYELRKSLWS